ncbi:Alpha/Beta hydrolase protein [Mycena albidolilacea]|uniref:Alpha/Beta hydrolase protein n=1 Tax=Mycena albidolilacea TaxID=1033008 RepID=A0AAD7AES3_9AGAR|nr:Alpha/Beta hydrolase protein [Mycena albidolilacea]
MVLPTLFLGFVATALGTPLAKFTATTAESLGENTNLPSEPLYPGAGEDFCVQLEDVGTQRALAKSTATAAVHPFRIDLAKGLPHLESLVKNTNLPSEPLYPDAGEDFGVQLNFLRDLKTQWVEGYNWTEEEAELNQLAQYTTTIGKQTVHFVHEKSDDKDAIPLLLIHGWPGSIQEFLPVIKPLTQSWTGPSGKKVSWTNVETGHLFDTLMTDVLGYSKYALHATDWVSLVTFLQDFFWLTNNPGCRHRLPHVRVNATVRAAHFVFFQFQPPSPKEIADKNITLSKVQKIALEHTMAWLTTGQGYFMEQTYKPNDIGLALYDNPVGQLAWIGGITKLWSDPRAGTAPSKLTHTAILTSVSLYYLTQTFQSAAWQYARNAGSFRTKYVKPPTDAPMLYSLFAYNILMFPEDYVAKLGNLVSYKEHDFGGHFPGLDNPSALIEDIREMGLYFK